jgi:heme A synthase
VLFEHGHRLAAMTVGVLQTVLAVLLWRRGGTLPRLGVLGLALVCAQGALGGLTVAFKLPTPVSTAHLMTAMAYFALTIYVAWRTRPADGPAPAPVSPRLRAWLGLAALAIYCQIALGALMRHTGGAIASLDLPLHHGQLWPAEGGLALKLHMLHRLVGVVVGVIAVAVAIAAHRRLAHRATLRLVAILAPVAVLAQIALGVLVIYSFRAVGFVVAHVGVAAGLWAIFVVLWLTTRAAAQESTAPAMPNEAVRV